MSDLSFASETGGTVQSDIGWRGRADWYYGSYPKGPSHDPRCLEVLGAWEALYNIPRTGRSRLDGGFRLVGDGVEVHLQRGYGDFSTYDDGSLTRLVVAAHALRCRLSIAVRGSYLVIQVFPRKAEGSMFERHPGLDDLRSQIDAHTGRGPGLCS